MIHKRHSWKEKRKEGYKTIQQCSNCDCMRQKVSTKIRMAIVGSKDYYAYESKWQYTTINGSTFYAPPCVTPSEHETTD